LLARADLHALAASSCGGLLSTAGAHDMHEIRGIRRTKPPSPSRGNVSLLQRSPSEAAGSAWTVTRSPQRLIESQRRPARCPVRLQSLKMQSRYRLRGTLPWLWLLLSLWACGRVGVNLVPAPADASVARADASVPPPPANIPVTPAGDGGAADPDAGPVPIDAAPADTTPDSSSAAHPDAAIVDAAVLDAAGADVEAGPQDVCGHVSSGACSGTLVLGLCWYLGAPGVTCTDACSAHGGFDLASTHCLGSTSQGGTLSRCHEVLSALGSTENVNLGMRADGLGLGCHVWSDGRPWWLDSPDANPDSAIADAQVACGCAH
jgi:hypothetical protein